MSICSLRRLIYVADLVRGSRLLPRSRLTVPPKGIAHPRREYHAPTPVISAFHRCISVSKANFRDAEPEKRKGGAGAKCESGDISTSLSR
jgi:hypothetical protein